MIDRDTIFVEKRRRFYENHYRVSEPMDAWHAYAQMVVHATTLRWFLQFGKSKGDRILNAGSGGSDYGITSPMVHLDLVTARISHLPRFIVGDVSQIPADDSSFDVILCVGSVLNYTNPIFAFREFQRVLRPGGVIVFEYERSGSPEYWCKHGRSSQCARVESFYGNESTELWVYGDELIDGLLALHRFQNLKEIRFHGLSSIALGISGSPRIAARCVWGDLFVSSLWPIRNWTSNRMLTVEKLAD